MHTPASTHTPTSCGDACYQSQNCGHKHMYTGHPLPDFYLQNTCKFAVKSGLDHRMGHVRHAARTRVLKPLFPPVLRSTACDVRMAEHAMRIVKIPVEGSPVVEARSQRICNLCCTPHTPQLGPNTPSHAVCWSAWRPGGRRHDRGRTSALVWEACYGATSVRACRTLKGRCHVLEQMYATRGHRDRRVTLASQGPWMPLMPPWQGGACTPRPPRPTSAATAAVPTPTRGMRHMERGTGT
jgi:hypothetical protein